MWDLDFIDRNDFKKHVSDTIKTYDNTLKGIITQRIVNS